MKAVTVIVAVMLCGVCLVTSAPSKSEASTQKGIVTSTTTAKPWTQKFKDGLGKFFQGVAIAGAVNQGFQNARSHKISKHKPALPDIKPTHS